MCGLTYIIKIFWEKTDLAICNCGAATFVTTAKLTRFNQFLLCLLPLNLFRTDRLDSIG